VGVRDDPDNGEVDRGCRAGAGVTDPWRILAAVLVVSMSILFALLLTLRRRRIRYRLRNRLTPLRVLSEEPAPIDRWLPWLILSVVVVVTLVGVAMV
jgi:hypothetical protein